MVKTYLSLPDDLAEWMKAQPMFFVASAPLDGVHVNVSPKGYPSRTFAILDPNTVAYIDGTGSGCETVAHIYENGRVTVMFCSFGISPKILRLFCQGRVIERDEKDFETIISAMGEGYGSAGARAVIVLRIFKAQTSCGFGVPLLPDAVKGGEKESATTENETTITATPGLHAREVLENRYLTFLRKDSQSLIEYRKWKNSRSMDGLPGLRTARRDKGEWLMLEDAKVRMRRLVKQWDAIMLGVLLTLSSITALRVLDMNI